MKAEVVPARIRTAVTAIRYNSLSCMAQPEASNPVWSGVQRPPRDGLALLGGIKLAKLKWGLVGIDHQAEVRRWPPPTLGGSYAPATRKSLGEESVLSAELAQVRL